MFLDCHFRATLCRADLNDYVRPLSVDVRCYGEQCADAYLVGKMAMDQILWADAQCDGESLFDIFDSDSQGMHEVYAILCDKKGRFKKELRISEVTSQVMFLHRAVFHPVVKPYAKAILDTAVNLFGQQTLVVMWRHVGELPEADLAEIGFCRIAGAELIFRHSTLQTRFSQQFPQGWDMDVIGELEYEDWVLERWEKPVIDEG